MISFKQLVRKSHFLSWTNISPLIQAEEAQRLRKRRIDERHLLDMQRRRKQCVEEVSETQKKFWICDINIIDELL